MLEVGAMPLLGALGFTTVDAVECRPLVAAATLRDAQQPVSLLVAPWGERLDGYWSQAIRDSLNRGAAWCVLFNGTHLRVLHAARVFSRRYLEFDLDLAADDEDTAAALRAVVNVAAFSATNESGQTSLAALVTASEQHRAAVCRSLRDGVLEASTVLLQALAERSAATIGAAEAFAQALTVVYRVLFLCFAEARALVPLWHPVYLRSYSLERLRDRALAGRTAGLWDTLRAISRLAHAGCRAGDLRVTPFNGRLFAPAYAPMVERRGLDDAAACRALVALSTRPSAQREGRQAIDYRDLGVEQLGAVYETLLDYTPTVRREGKTRRSRVTASLEPGSGIRKATGSFYTPPSITSYLIRRTLGPLVADATPEQILDLRILDPAMGSGAFLVGACTYLADAYERALIRAGGCHPRDIGQAEQATIRRTIAERCLYGVDLNPTAVQLARLSLWLVTLAADRPLSFLDHHLRVGDSIVGTWIHELRRPPARRYAERPLPLFDGAGAAADICGVLPSRFRLTHVPSDTAAEVRAKERLLASLSERGSVLTRWKRVANLWCAHWFSRRPANPRLFSALCDHILTGRSVLAPELARAWLEPLDERAESGGFFHWELEFPEVFFAADGTRRADAGFDAIIGNPPWEMVRADPRAGGTAEPLRRDVVRFTREAGLYTAQSDGHANQYQIFLERAIALSRPAGRLGLVLPAGLASDHGSAALRRHLFTHCAVESIVGFDNRRAVFPIHRSVRFLLLSAVAGVAPGVTCCRFGEVDPQALDRLDEKPLDDRSAFPVQLTPALLERLSGRDLTIPDLRSPMDLAIAERAAALFPPLGSADSWHARFGRELNATDDRHHIGPRGRGMPVLGGRHVEPFRARLDEAEGSIARRTATRLLGERVGRVRLAYRDVASAGNRVTLIAALLPAGCVSTHTLLCLKTPLVPDEQHFLCALFNSLVVNYLVRLRVSTHVTTAIVERLPIPSRVDAGLRFDDIAALGRNLARRPDPDDLARLNALVARLYELSAADFDFVLETFPLVPAGDRRRAAHMYRQIA